MNQRQSLVLVYFTIVFAFSWVSMIYVLLDNPDALLTIPYWMFVFFMLFDSIIGAKFYRLESEPEWIPVNKVIPERGKKSAN